jgi:aromatic-L-amino-acid/L-tryptophan decarboxylase
LSDRTDCGLNDMPEDEFRRFGHELIEWVANYLATIEERPVLSRVRPGQIKKTVSPEAPENGEPMERILADLDDLIVPGITHWNHPSFHAYFSITGSSPGILGELLIAAFNVNGMLWKTSPAATELEEVVVGWLRRWLGLPAEFWGIIYDTASTSTFHAIAAAREDVPGLDCRQNGLTGGPELRLYASEQAHSSVEKAAIGLGLGLRSVRKVPTDNQFRMDPGALSHAIGEDRRQGFVPFCAVATVGTTSTTSVDPVPEIAAICRRNGIWLHVDAAYAGPAAILPEKHWILDGCTEADSLVTNPHKWLFTPIDASVLFCRRPEILKRAFSLVPDYLRSEDEATNFMDFGIQLGRRFRALKLWMVMRYFGRLGVEARLREHIRLAQELAGWIEDTAEFELAAPTPFSTVCFRWRPHALVDRGEDFVDDLNERLIAAVNATGEAFLASTRLKGRSVIRLAIGNLRITQQRLERTWQLLCREAARLAELA